jgi:hypothetical protein
MDKPSPTPSGPARTFYGEAVHTSSDPEEMRAYLESLLACDPAR